MKTTIETITPERARELLASHLLKSGDVFDPMKKQHAIGQRAYDPEKAQHFARLMQNGQFGLTHQGIAIDTDGNLIDGQHRLAGIIISGKTVQMNVSVGVPALQQGAFTFDMIDRGSTRTIGQQLAKHGATDTNRLAAAARCLIMLAAEAYKIRIRKSEVGDVLKVLDHYGDELGIAMGYRASMNGLRTAQVTGALAFALKVGDREAICQFAERYKTGADCKPGDPALTVRNWLLSNYLTLPNGGAAHGVITRMALTGCMYAERQTPLKTLRLSESGYNYFAAKQRKTMTKLLADCGYTAG